jgi:hypothetical protein
MEFAASLFWIAASAMVLAEVYFLLIVRVSNRAAAGLHSSPTREKKDVLGKNALARIITVVRDFVRSFPFERVITAG